MKTACVCGGLKSSTSKQCRACEDTQRGLSRQRICEWCHKKFRCTVGQKRSGRFCSKKCSGARIRAKTLQVQAEKREMRSRRSCRVCARSFKSTRYRTTCSDICAEEMKRRRHVRQHGLQCGSCGGPLLFRKGRTRNKFCSVVCRRREANNRESTKDARRIARALRKARKRGSSYEQVDPYKVFGRDRWTCQLCRMKTPRRLRGTTYDHAPELDHIVALVSGGSHTYTNTQCLCRKCNLKKGRKTLGQLRLAI
jgi:hypothetical protein